jgi:hypothetical protein
MPEQVVIERRFRGPPNSANGGYACGVVASGLAPDPAIEVTLTAPPPLDRPLEIAGVDGGVELRDADTVIAEGRPAAAPELELPDPVSLEDATEARRTSPSHQDHPFPMCFVCGTERPEDGLNVILGVPPGRNLVAAPFEPTAEFADADHNLRNEIVWAVLDCPGGVAAILEPGLGLSMLGRLTALIERPVPADRDYVAVGWPIEHDGRKFHAGSAIFTPEGEPLAWARATWIELREQPG